MIIALDARPLVMRQASGVAQHARNIVAQWAASNGEHYFVLVLDRKTVRRPDSDISLVSALGPRFAVKILQRRIAMASLLGPTGTLPAVSARLLGVTHLDVFHSFTSLLPCVCMAPMVMTIHDLACELDLSVRRTRQARAQRTLNRWAVRRARRIVAVSTQTRNDIVNVYGLDSARVQVIFNGINPTFKPAPDPTVRQRMVAQCSLPSRYILSVGSDIPRRNYPRLLLAMQQVWRVDPGLKWLLVGHNRWPNTAIYRQAQAAGIQSQMAFIESPSDPELAQLYRDAVLTCCGSSFEGFGLSVLEAMACGCPVACSDMTSLREAAGKAVLFFAHDDPESMARAILALAEDPEYRRQLSQRGIVQTAGFTWSAAARTLMDILEQCVAPANGAPQPQ